MFKVKKYTKDKVERVKLIDKRTGDVVSDQRADAVYRKPTVRGGDPVTYGEHYATLTEASNGNGKKQEKK